MSVYMSFRWKSNVVQSLLQCWHQWLEQIFILPVAQSGNKTLLEINIWSITICFYSYTGKKQTKRYNYTWKGDNLKFDSRHTHFTKHHPWSSLNDSCSGGHWIYCSVPYNFWRVVQHEQFVRGILNWYLIIHHRNEGILPHSHFKSFLYHTQTHLRDGTIHQENNMSLEQLEISILSILVL